MYADLLRQAGSPKKVLEMIATPGFNAQDQWQVQIQAQIQQNVDVYIYSDGLSESQIEAALFHSCSDIEQTLIKMSKTYGPRICVLPEGPQTIPYLIDASYSKPSMPLTMP
jgi:hypothetical protein